MTTAKTEVIKTNPLFRDLVLDRANGIDVDARTVELAFSSETEVQRWFGFEVLDHSPGSCDLSRLQNGAALLDNHNQDLQIGVVENARIDNDRVGRAVVRFSKRPEAEAIFQDVQDGIIRHVSVGYRIKRVVEENTKDASGRDKTIARVTSWTPMEISLVSIPADPSVGLGRSAGAEEVETTITRAATITAPAPEQSNQTRIQVMTDKTADQLAEEQRNAGIQTEQKRTAELIALADTFEKYGARSMVGDFIRTGKTAEAFQRAIMDKMTERHSDASDSAIGMSEKEIKSYSIRKAIMASIDGNWSLAGFEREVSNEVAKRTGMTAEGFFVPVDAFSKRTFNVGTSTEAGNLVQTSVLGNEFVDVLRNAMVLSKLGVRILGGLSGNIAIPRKTASSTIASLAETAAITASNPTTNQITLTPKRIGGQVPYSKQALIQASLDVDNMIQDDLAQSIAVQIENLAINGTGSTNQPRGVLNQSGIGSVIGGTNGAQIAWNHLVDLESACANANSEPDARAAYLVNTKSRGAMKKTQKATYLDYIWDRTEMPLNGYRALVTNNVASNGTKGTSTGVCSSLLFGSDWSDLVLGLFGGLDVVVDPYTLAGSGQVQITANQFIDVALRQAASFAAMTDALTA